MNRTSTSTRHRMLERLRFSAKTAGHNKDARHDTDTRPENAAKQERITIEQNCALSRLPRELLDMVLCEMGIASLAHLSLTCRWARTVLSSWAPWREVALHATEAIGAITVMRPTTHFTVPNLQQALRSPTCTATAWERPCGNVAALLYLPTCKRICLNCLEVNNDHRVVEESVLCRVLDVEPADLAGVAAMHTAGGPSSPWRDFSMPLPAIRSGWSPPDLTAHSLDMPLWDQPLRLLNLRQAMEVALEVHGCDPMVEHRFLPDRHGRYGPARAPTSNLDYNKSCVQWQVFSRDSAAYWPHQSACHPVGRVGSVNGEMMWSARRGPWAAVPVPYIPPGDGGAERGLSKIRILRNCMWDRRVARCENGAAVLASYIRRAEKMRRVTLARVAASKKSHAFTSEGLQ